MMAKNKARTICAKCKWARCPIHGRAADYFCKHPDTAPNESVNVITGNVEPAAHPLCFGINNGNCPRWEPK